MGPGAWEHPRKVVQEVLAEPEAWVRRMKAVLEVPAEQAAWEQHLERAVPGAPEAWEPRMLLGEAAERVPWVPNSQEEEPEQVLQGGQGAEGQVLKQRAAREVFPERDQPTREVWAPGAAAN